ncbi:helix-turn-helix transcriptional regulator [Streptomyces sp. NPDC006552]|uniref:helix-turn-helix domain-containing protein n=1 Tax=Streptomyces sp. NPDC006552 TaxID=3157179 RepID=UPI0033A3B9FF
MESKVADNSKLRKIQLTPTLFFVTEQQKRRRGAVEMGPTAAVVAVNVRRIRDEVRGWSTYELAGKLSKLGRPIAPSAVSKIERGERQVTVDDLFALAYALQVNPNALLLPPTAEGQVDVTAAGALDASVAWDWAEGERPLNLPEGDDGTAHNQFQADVRPAGRRRFVSGPAKVTAKFAGRHGSSELRGVVADDLRRQEGIGSDGRDDG